MKKATSFELETMEYLGGGNTEARATYEGGRFSFVLNNGLHFEVSREELAQLVDETGEDAPVAPFPLVYFETMSQAESFLRRNRGRVVSLIVQRKGGNAEMREFECYRISQNDGRLTVFSYNLNHEHYERVPLASIRAGRATSEEFTPKYEVEL